MTSALLVLAALAPAAPPPPVADLKLPPGFSATLYADHALANDVYTITVDDAGRVLVAGRGYVRVLVDDDSDGRADRAVDLIDGLKDGPMGLLAEGDSLYVVADGGLKRYRGYNGRDTLKGPPETLVAVKTAGEHDAHAVRRGPDGWLYLLCGNMSGVKAEQLDPRRSPVRDPVAGCLLRVSPDGKTVEAVADGFRNAYGFDFDPAGEAFTYDSDNERCGGLPWYEPCRFYHVVPGGNYGWRSPQLSQTWRKPPYFADVVPPVCTTGRGSPTGVECYRHAQFPARYRGGFFLADWTFGRVYFVPLEAKGATYAGKAEPFLEAVGESGFAPTGLAVHPQSGDLLVSIGGRGTRGGVYRVRYDKGDANPKPLPVAKRSLEWDATAAKGWLADAAGDDALKRRRALDLMRRWYEKLGYEQPLFDATKRGLTDADPLVRAAGARFCVAATIPVGPLLLPPVARLAAALEEVRTDPAVARAVVLKILREKPLSTSEKLIAVRVLQLSFGDLTAPNAVGTVWEGYTLRKPPSPEQAAEVAGVLRSDLRTGNADLDRELARTLAALDAGPLQLCTAVRAKLVPESDVREDIHYLIVLGRADEPWGGWHAVRAADALLWLDRKAVRQGVTRDRFWPVRLEEIATALAKKPELAETVLSREEFGRPEHVVFVRSLGLDRAEAARKFLGVANTTPDYAWTPAVVALLGALPADEARPVLRKLWDRGGLEDAVVAALARAPHDDAAKFVAGLRSFEPEVVRACAAALATLPAPTNQADVIAAIGALRRQPADKGAAAVRDALAALLRARTGQALGPDAAAWAAWFAKAHPALAAKLSAADGFDAAAWAKRVAVIPWADGDAKAGRAVFAKASCAACHDGGGAVGPSLAGVGKRFGRDDLLTAILQPSKDVSPRYRPVRVATADGKAYVGMVVYEAADGVILQTGADATVRVAGSSIELKRTLDVSLMPAGLLDKLTDREVADLLAYLRAPHERR